MMLGWVLYMLFLLVHWLLRKAREQHRPNLWDCLLYHQLQPLINGVRAYDSAFACVQNDTAHA